MTVVLVTILLFFFENKGFKIIQNNVLIYHFILVEKISLISVIQTLLGLPTLKAVVQTLMMKNAPIVQTRW